MSEVKGSKVIVVGVDGSQSSQEALRWAVREARLRGDAVRVMMAWQYPIVAGSMGWGPMVVADNWDMQAVGEKIVAEAVGNVAEEADSVTIEQRVVEGNAADILVRESAGTDLLVVGSRGHGTFADALLGSVSQNCAHHARCPVVIVRGNR